MDSKTLLKNKQSIKWQAYAKFILFSTFGFILYFVPITIAGSSSIPIDHIVTNLKNSFPIFTKYYTIIIVYLGALLPFYDKTWNRNIVNKVLTLLKIIATIFATMFLLGKGPDVLMAENMIPFLFVRICYSVALVVPIGAALLTFIVDYGLLEFLGVLMRSIMKPIWKVPGSASVTAVASFVGSFSVGIFLTNQLYKEGKYTKKESALIMTGFSTVSATFMVIVAKTLGFMDMWIPFFFAALVITFLTSAIVSRIYPLKKIPNTYYNDINNSDNEDASGHGLFKTAIEEALKTSNNSVKTHISLWCNFRDGLLIIMRLLPLMISIGTIAFYFVYHTQVFDVIGYIYYPVLKLLQVPDALLVSKAAALAGAEMFVPTAIVASAGASVLAKFITGMISVSSIMFFAGTIPCILATDIELSIKDMLLILVERTYIIIVLSNIIGLIIL
jgi:nucleoside recognition membrane protein YjiH